MEGMRSASGLAYREAGAADDPPVLLHGYPESSYWKGYEGDVRRRGQLELYRSLELARYEGRLAALGVPVLLLWGANDAFAPVAGAHRFERDLPDTELVVIEDAGHFVFEDASERCAEAVTGFMARS
jgi:haloalkane dehalogenase